MEPADVSNVAIGETVEFKCYVTEGNVLWYINDTYALKKSPDDYRELTVRVNNNAVIENSTLSFRIVTMNVNNSMIQCAVGMSSGIMYPDDGERLLIGK